MEQNKLGFSLIAIFGISLVWMVLSFNTVLGLIISFLVLIMLFGLKGNDDNIAKLLSELAGIFEMSPNLKMLYWTIIITMVVIGSYLRA